MMELHLQASLELLCQVGSVWDVPGMGCQVILIRGCFKLEAPALHTPADRVLFQALRCQALAEDMLPLSINGIWPFADGHA